MPAAQLLRGFGGGGAGLITNCQFFDLARGITCTAASLTTVYNCTVHHSSAYGIYRVLAKNCFVGGSATSCYL